MSCIQHTIYLPTTRYSFVSVASALYKPMSSLQIVIAEMTALVGGTLIGVVCVVRARFKKRRDRQRFRAIRDKRRRT